MCHKHLLNAYSKYDGGYCGKTLKIRWGVVIYHNYSEEIFKVIVTKIIFIQNDNNNKLCAKCWAILSCISSDSHGYPLFTR